MFYTLTANPAVDMTVSSSPLEPDENVRTGSASYTANGKGLDVSFAFKKMGVDTVALGFFAGFTGKFIVEEVMNLGCLCRPVWTDGITRINTYVNDGQHEYGILNPGAPITPQHQEELYNILDTAGDLECLIGVLFDQKNRGVALGIDLLDDLENLLDDQRRQAK